MANVAATNTTGLYGTTNKTPVLNSAQQLLSLLDNNGNVNFALDPATGNTTVYSYFTGNAGGGGGSGTLSLYGDVNASGSLGAPILTVLTPTGVTSGTYGNATSIPVINVGADGRVDSITTVATAASSYSNANVASYLPVYNGNITAAYVNIAQLLTTQRANVTGNVNAGNVNTTGYFVGDGSKLTNLPIGPNNYGNANVAAYMPTYLPTYHGTLSPTIISTDNYQFANGQPYIAPTSYGNANVAAYLASGTDSTINTLQSEITGANAAIVTANTAMKSYVDSTEATITSAWTANAATQAAQIASTNANVTAANAAITATTDELHSFEVYANATFSTGSYGNTQVAAYLPTYTGTVQAGNITTTAGGTHNIGSSGAPFNTINVGSMVGPSGSVVRVDTGGSQPGLYVATTGIQSFGRDFAVNDPTFTTGVTLTQSGLITATNTITGANYVTPGVVLAQGNITANAAAGAFFIGDGSKLINLPTQAGTYSNSNVASYLPTYSGSLNNSSSIISLQGNITAANAAILATTDELHSFETYANATYLTSATAYGNANVAAYLPTYTGNLKVGNIMPYSSGIANMGSATNVFADVYFARVHTNNVVGSAGDVLVIDSAPPGTSGDGVYILNSGVAVTNKWIGITSDNGTTYPVKLNPDGTIVAAGNITVNTGAYYIGDGSKLTGITANSIVGSYGNANVAAYLPTYSGNIGGTLTTAAQTNVTSVGTLTGLTVSGSATFQNGATFQNPISAAGTTASIGALTVGTTIVATGNITANAGAYFIGDGSKLANITATPTGSAGGDLTGTYPNPTLTLSGAVAGTYGNATYTPQVTVDSKGRVTSISNVAISAGSSFTGNLAGSTLTDSVNQRILANASPASSLPSTSSSSQVAAVFTTPTYTTGVLQAPAAAQSVIIAQSANIALQSSYASSGARNTIGSESYVSVYPTTANSMFNSDRVRSTQAHLDVFPSGKTWGNVTTNASQAAPVLSAAGTQVTVIGTGAVAHIVGQTASSQVIPSSGSANVAYQTGVFSSLGWGTPGTGATASNIANVRLISGNVAVTSQANLTINNAIGLHTAVGWAGAGSLVTNRYAVLNEDVNTTIQSAGNIVLAGSAGIKFNDGTFQTTAATGGGGGLSWQSVQTSNFTATAGSAYPVNTNGGNITVTLPSSPSAGQITNFTDYSGNFATAGLTIYGNGAKIDGGTGNVVINNARESIALVYIDSTQGWIPYSGFNTSTPYVIPTTYNVQYLIVAGGGGGGNGRGGGGGAGGFLTGNSSVTPGTTYSFVVGAGGPGNYSGADVSLSNGNNSTGLSLTAIGGGAGSGDNATGGNPNSYSGQNGGSGGGALGYSLSTIGSGTVGQGNDGGTGNLSGNNGAGGGGGAGAVGNNGLTTVGGAGGAGLANPISGSTTGQNSGGTYYLAGGGGGGVFGSSNTSGQAAGGLGGGGASGYSTVIGVSATANTGGGGGAGSAQGGGGYYGAGAGGSGVVILSVPTTKYSGITTGSPTVTTSGSNTILTFTSSGSYTA